MLKRPRERPSLSQKKRSATVARIAHRTMRIVLEESKNWNMLGTFLVHTNSYSRQSLNAACGIAGINYYIANNARVMSTVMPTVIVTTIVGGDDSKLVDCSNNFRTLDCSSRRCNSRTRKVHHRKWCWSLVPSTRLGPQPAIREPSV
jgi:hypothetical protein